VAPERLGRAKRLGRRERQLSDASNRRFALMELLQLAARLLVKSMVIKMQDSALFTEKQW
jgi:hypothetical protein